MTTTTAALVGHCDRLLAALGAFRAGAGEARRWGGHLARVVTGGGRLLVACDGADAAPARHLTVGLTGGARWHRPAGSASALRAATSRATAIARHHGGDGRLADRVRALGRRGDVLLLLSTGGADADLLTAAAAGRRAGLTVWALTGPAPNPLTAACHAALCAPADTTATVPELHLVAVHLLGTACHEALATATADGGAPHTATAGGRPEAAGAPGDALEGDTADA